MRLFRRNCVILISYIRLKLNKLMGKNILFQKWVLVSPSATIEVNDTGILKLERGIKMLDRVVISVRDNASLQVGRGVFINRNTIIVARESIRISDGVTIGPNVCIYDHDHDAKNRGGVCFR